MTPKYKPSDRFMIEGLAEEVKPIRVRVDKAKKDFWYADRVGMEFLAFDDPADAAWYITKGPKGYRHILKSDCTILPTKDEGKDVPPGDKGEPRIYHHKLDQAAKNWASGFHGTLPQDQAERLAFKAGAKWENEQSVKSANATKLPPQQQPEPVDRERLERFVLAAMAGNAQRSNSTASEYSFWILNLAVTTMTTVDNYKPVTN